MKGLPVCTLPLTPPQSAAKQTTSNSWQQNYCHTFLQSSRPPRSLSWFITTMPKVWRRVSACACLIRIAAFWERAMLCTNRRIQFRVVLFFFEAQYYIWIPLWSGEAALTETLRPAAFVEIELKGEGGKGGDHWHICYSATFCQTNPSHLISYLVYSS